MSNLDKAKEIFSKDYYAAELTGVEIIEAEAGHARCRLEICDKHKNALGEVMGGVLFTLADYTFAIASNFEQLPTVTQTSQIAFLSAVKGNTLYSEAIRIKGGKKTCFYKIVITDDTGRENAYVTTTGFVVGN